MSSGGRPATSRNAPQASRLPVDEWLVLSKREFRVSSESRLTGIFYKTIETSAGKKPNEAIEGDIRGPADSQVMALIIPQLSFGAISETPRLKIQTTIIQSLSVPWGTQEELMDEMSGPGNA